MYQFSELLRRNNMLFVDVQGFKTNGNLFLPKELAVYDGDHISHYVFEPPFPFPQLDPDFRQQAMWLMLNHHCIDWEKGATPLHAFPDIIKQLTQNADIIYVKGLEKANFIRRYVTAPVQELEEQPKLTTSKPSCFYHSRQNCYCALSIVYSLYTNYVLSEVKITC